ncbi:DUF6153 family protein [Paenarthrobacter sp. NPDC018779]|uniref:DUF6153 family protein n=1 Tax=Paenarthrobacter sp. NPDC018779 TaxID=3364375 RepID=UPI0037CA3AEA
METLGANTRSFLRTAGLFAAVFALIAGILGMHVMTGTHSLHATAAATHTAQAAAEVSSSGHCSCATDCTDQHVNNVSCTPTVASGALAAPAPDNRTVLPATLQPLAFTTGAVWQYRPDGPSPGDLSISRT